MAKRYSIEDMNDYVSNRGGVCLSKEYIDERSLLKWKCEKGHTWDADFQIIRQGGWCPACLKKHTDKLARLEEMKDIAKERGGICLSAEYVHHKEKLEFRCNKFGHVWKMAPKDIKAGQWCPKCGIMRRAAGRRAPIEIYQKIAKERGGKLLSDSYKNGHTKLLWECSKGHQWYATPAMVRHAESWCPYCRGYHKTINDMQELAAKHGGKCLSKEYVNTTTKLEWECAKGHIWKSAPANVVNNYWCPKCGYEVATEKQKDNIEKYRKVAIERGGKLLTEKYTNNRTLMLWECAKGHQWKARGANVLHMDSWCPYCWGKIKHTIEHMHEVAAERNGQYLSTEYINSSTKSEWQCEKGHQWMATSNDIIQGSWCPYCAGKKKPSPSP